MVIEKYRNSLGLGFAPSSPEMIGRLSKLLFLAITAGIQFIQSQRRKKKKISLPALNPTDNT